MFTNLLELTYADELHDYDIYPKVVPAGKASAITIRPLGAHAQFSGTYQLSIHPWHEGQHSQFPDRPNNFTYDAAPEADGCIRFTFDFFGEQQYYVRLKDDKKFKLQLSVYSVFEDLVGRYPFRGDLHLHTTCSDGRQSPPVVAANYRRTGYDFLAITDHNRYFPSLDAIAAYKDVPTGLTIVPGEEVHMPDDNGPGEAWQHLNAMHIVNFGGEYSINALIDDGHLSDADHAPERRGLIPNPPPVRSVAEHWAEIDEYMKTLDIPDKIKGRERYLIASCHWVFEEIRRAGGLGIFAHPYWLNNVLSFPPQLVDYIMESQHFDAFEVLGGESYYEQNGYQIAQYYDDCAKGRRYPVVGSTDSHNSHFSNRNAHVCCTLVFSPANERRALIDSVKDFYSVAVDTMDETPRFVGDFRLVRYACFLYRNFFPLHDELCFEEGRAMKDYVCGEPGAKKILEALDGRMQAQLEKYFAF